MAAGAGCEISNVISKVDGDIVTVTSKSCNDAWQGQVCNETETPREVHDELASLFGSLPSSVGTATRTLGEVAADTSQRRQNDTDSDTATSMEQILTDCQLDCQRLDDLLDRYPPLALDGHDG